MALFGPGVPRPIAMPRSLARIRASYRRPVAAGRPYHPPVTQPRRPVCHAGIVPHSSPPTPGVDRRRTTDRRRRSVRRPARDLPARKRAPGTERALDLLHGRPGGGPRGTGGGIGPVRRGTPPRRPARPDAAPRGCPAVRRRARRLPRVRPRPCVRTPAVPRGRRPGAAAAPARAPRLGRGVGSPVGDGLARRPGPRWRRAPAGPPPRRGPRAPDRATTSRPGPGPTSPTRRASTDGPLRFVSGLDRAAYEAGVEVVRARIAAGEIYQANLTRRLGDAVRRPARGNATAGSGPATRRSSRRTSTSVRVRSPGGPARSSRPRPSRSCPSTRRAS